MGHANRVSGPPIPDDRVRCSELTLCAKSGHLSLLRLIERPALGRAPCAWPFRGKRTTTVTR